MPVLPDRHPPPQPSWTPAQAALAVVIADALRNRPDLLPSRDKGPRGWGPGIDEYRPLAVAVVQALEADGWSIEFGPAGGRVNDVTGRLNSLQPLVVASEAQQLESRR